MKDSGSIGGIFSSIISGSVFYGILNALTGMLGVKLFIQNKIPPRDYIDTTETE